MNFPSKFCSTSEKMDWLEKNVGNFLEANFDLYFKEVPDLPKETKDASNYGKNLTSLGLFFLNLRDGIKEGDARRNHLLWKGCGALFHLTRKRNYLREHQVRTALLDFILPPYYSNIFMWNDCLNPSGKAGGNYPADLAQEFENKKIKEDSRALGSNLGVEDQRNRGIYRKRPRKLLMMMLDLSPHISQTPPLMTVQIF